MNIVRPTLLLDEAKCKANIQRMAAKAKRSHVTFRPHFKTHQSLAVGRWIRASGVTKCTVSSVKMAAYFAADGWNDITIAFPLNFLEVAEINRLASTITLNLCLVDVAAVEKLTKKLDHPVNCFIEVDSGYHRTGVDPADHTTINSILSFISAHPLLTFKGFLSHAGQSYASRTSSEILKSHQQSTAQMRKAGDRYRNDYPDMVLSIGDTPSCSVATDFSGVDEIRPGNFVFYDVMQTMVGACTKNDIAVAMACPVVAVYPQRKEVIVHGGGVHFSKDFLKGDDGGSRFGEAVKLNSTGWELPPLSMYVKSLSQEHGILHASAEETSKIEIGDVLGVLPVHSCMTADAMGEYYTLGGEKIEMMRK